MSRLHMCHIPTVVDLLDSILTLDKKIASVENASNPAYGVVVKPTPDSSSVPVMDVTQKEVLSIIQARRESAVAELKALGIIVIPEDVPEVRPVEDTY